MTRALLFTAALLLATNVAGAQNAPLSPTAPSQPSTVGAAPPSGPPQAPIGHRQPKLSDLPPAMAGEEKANDLDMQRKALEGDLDKRLRICNGC